MSNGTVKWFNAQKGYEFIQPEGGGKDVFVHILVRSNVQGCVSCEKASASHSRSLSTARPASRLPRKSEDRLDCKRRDPGGGLAFSFLIVVARRLGRG